MTLPTVKTYRLTGEAWSSQHLSLNRDGSPYLYINTNNKYGPWRSPYVTLQEQSPTGPIVAAAKLGYPGCQRSFKIFLGNPDCTDLATWPAVKCGGIWASEYRFCVPVTEGQAEGMWECAWRRTRDREALGAGGGGHRDYKLVVLRKLVSRKESGLEKAYTPEIEERLVDVDEKKEDVPIVRANSSTSVDEMRTRAPLNDDGEVIAVYLHKSSLKGCKRAATINWFQSLPPDVELWCLAAVLGLQEKITTNKQAFAIGYYGALTPLGSFI